MLGKLRSAYEIGRCFVELDWTGHENSLVSVGIDDGAQVPISLHLRVIGNFERILDWRPLPFHGLEMLNPVPIWPLSDGVGNVLPRLDGVRHESLSCRKAVIFEEMLDVEVLAHIGEVPSGLEHGEVDPTSVGGPEVADGGIDGQAWRRVERTRRHHLADH